MEILDIPHLHKYQNDIADEFFESLAETDCIEIFSNSSIQALIEIKWPLVKSAIKKYLFYPYLVFILLFLYYTVGVFEKFVEPEAAAATDAPADGTAIDPTGPTPTETAALILQSTLADKFKNVPNFNEL